MGTMREQAIRRGVVQLKMIQSVRRSRVAQPESMRHLARGVCESVEFTTGSTGKPGRVNAISGWSVIVTTTTILGSLLLLAAVTMSVLAALAKSGA